MTKKTWREIERNWSDFKPLPRSGHTSCVVDDNLFIFGGIFELTKELNDLIVFSFKEQKFFNTRSPDEEKDEFAELGVKY